MVNYYINAHVEHDPIENLVSRLVQYLTKEHYKLSHQQENYILFSRKRSSLFYLPPPMEENSTIRIDFGKEEGNGNYPLGLQLSINKEFLEADVERYWNSFVKSLEELIVKKITMLKEHHEIKEKYFQAHPFLVKQKIPKIPILLIVVILYLVIKVLAGFYAGKL